MHKSGLLSWLQAEYRQWELFLEQFGPAAMGQPDVTGHWSMKDVVAHLTGWNRNLAARLQAASGEPQPPPPWPAHLQTDDEINAWIYAASHERSVDASLRVNSSTTSTMTMSRTYVPGWRTQGNTRRKSFGY